MKKSLSLLLIPVMAIGLTDLGVLVNPSYAGVQTGVVATVNASTSTAALSKQKQIEQLLNLANNSKQEWTYDKTADAWVLSIVSAVAYPELPDQQGVSVAVPGAYVLGIDTNKDGKVNITSKNYTKATLGALVINTKGKVVSTNGQVYTASTAPVILNTGAAGYGSQKNALAPTTHASSGYINVVCGNRGKQDSLTINGKTTYIGDAPSCLVDQKAAARFVKYNILLGNLPGSINHFVSTGGSGGGAHSTMFATTSNNEDFYDYQIAAGAVGVYKNANGTYNTSVTIKGKSYAISDGAWGTIAYSPITSLYEADMAMAFEYTLDAKHSFNTAFQSKLAKYLSESYMNYINEQNLSVKESAVGFDLNKDNDKSDVIKLSINYDPKTHPETNGYYGTYLDLYLAEFTENLQWYLDNLDYAKDWTWFDTEGKPLSDEKVATMTSKEKVIAFLNGQYTKSANASKGMFGGGMPPGGMNGLPAGMTPPTGTTPPMGNTGTTLLVGTPNAGTTQSASSKVDSSNYKTFEEMVSAYKADIKEIQAGDQYGNNLVSLYNPLVYIGAKGTQNPTWIRLVSGAHEGDISMLNSLNLQLKALNSGIDATIEWQWDGGHVPSETLSSSFALTVDQMYGEHVKGAVKISGPAKAEKQSKNGTSTTQAGKSIASWVDTTHLDHVTFTLADIAAYRTSGASKATPGFDAIDYGQEDYVFGDKDSDARHWNVFLLEIFEKYADVLSPLFNSK